MVDSKEAWENEYKTKGRLWSGRSENIKLCGPTLIAGCGNGSSMRNISTEELWGVDISYHALVLAKKLSGSFIAKKVFLINCDVLALPFRNDFFKSAVMNHLLSHIMPEKQAEALGEILRVLNPGAVLHLRDFSTGDIRYGNGKKIAENTFIRGNNIIYHYFCEEKFQKLIDGINYNGSCFIIENMKTKKWEHGRGTNKMQREEIIAILRKKEIE